MYELTSQLQFCCQCATSRAAWSGSPAGLLADATIVSRSANVSSAGVAPTPPTAARFAARSAFVPAISPVGDLPRFAFAHSRSTTAGSYAVAASGCENRPSTQAADTSPGPGGKNVT